MINITEKARVKLLEISEGEGFEKCSIRTMIKSGGCNGFQFDLIFDEMIKELDETFEMDGIQVIIDQLSCQYMEGIVLDWVETDFGGGFQFRGGEIKSSCGCGNSVGF